MFPGGAGALDTDFVSLISVRLKLPYEVSCSTEVVQKYTHLGARGLGSTAAALLLSCAFPAALCGVTAEDGQNDIPQFFLTPVSKLRAASRQVSLCSSGLTSLLQAPPPAALSGRYPETVTGGWWGWFLLLYFAPPQPLPGRQHQPNHLEWMRGTLPPSLVPVPGHLLGTRPFLGIENWFCFLPT